jgi:hypothetical protein
VKLFVCFGDLLSDIPLGTEDFPMGFMLDDSVPVGSTAKFVVYGTALGLAVDLAVYPAELLKTRLQVTRQVRGFRGEVSLSGPTCM